MRNWCKTVCLLLVIITTGYAQEKNPVGDSQKAPYRSTEESKIDLVHTKLDIVFDIPNAHAYGKEWLTASPYFYSTDSLVLDAKYMEIKKVSLNGKDLQYDYSDNLFLRIKLDRVYSKNEQFTVYIEYISKPDEAQVEGSAAINDAKGLYFIDPKDEDPDKPTQIWTQGETEASSVWFPTIDAPNQKTTQELTMTVPEKWATLSNGILTKSKKNSDGTKSDTWVFDKPHAPYLFFMGAGEYSVVKDKWNGLDVDYYVEKEYEPYAKGIFGLTPEMMTFYSDYTGVPYPWHKYSQIISRDYVSGAMENTTAVIHQETANQTDRQLIDKNVWEDTIAHELFHHWFGDYVTTESWSHLTLNESFANYGEYLWREHKYGKAHAQAHRWSDLNGYFANPANVEKNLVRHHYANKEDMFDAVSYNKGGGILHMLRKMIGDEAFKESIKEYLTTYKYSATEADQLRLSFEKVTGKDLTPFFNQWYYGAGHPVLDIKYAYDAASKKASARIMQTQNGQTFEFPVKIGIVKNGQVEEHTITISQKEEIFNFDADTKPDAIIFDTEKSILTQITENKKVTEYLAQFKASNEYLDKLFALEGVEKATQREETAEIFQLALQDDYFGTRGDALKILDKLDISFVQKLEKQIAKIANSDPKTIIKAEAISLLAKLDAKKYNSVFMDNVNHKSYAVQAAALEGFYTNNPDETMAKVEAMDDVSPSIYETIVSDLIAKKNISKAAFIGKNIDKLPLSQELLTSIIPNAVNMIGGDSNVENVKPIVNLIGKYGEQLKQYGFDRWATQMLGMIKSKNSNQEILQAVDTELAKF